MSTKVFVGNLNFRTTDQDLLDLFGQAGAVKSTSIITRGRRSLGYGFIEFGSPADANAAVSKFNGSQLLERAIKVEVAKEPQERAPREPRAPRPPKPAGNGEQKQGKPQAGGNGDGDDAKPRRPRRRAPKKAGGAAAAGAASGAPGSPGTAAPARQRQPRPPRPERPKVISDTTLFVANLPFSVDDAALLAIFAGLKPKSAHVVRTRNDRSRGYGFVEFATKADQQAALSAKNGADVESATGPRKITVSVSTTPAPTAADSQ